MAESSYLWTTGSVGDGASTYTRTDWKPIAEVFSACMAFEGVAPSYLNALIGSTTGANNARIATGGAVVDGKPYVNGANVDVTIPSASGGGNTRIDRVVLRANWAAQTVRITLISGVDAASPTAPAITQTPLTVYDIKLYQALVNTSGTVTLTDERVFAQVGNSNALAAGIVTLTKMAADSVDDTNVGNRVPALTRRQGGSATGWISPGTTTYTPTTVRMQAGVSTLSPGGVVITFPTAFSQVPLVIAINLATGTLLLPLITGQSAVSFTVSLYNLSSVDVGGNLAWLAIGTE